MAKSFLHCEKEQKGLLKEMWDKDRYEELSKILDDLYPIAYGAAKMFGEYSQMDGTQLYQWVLCTIHDISFNVVTITINHVGKK